MALEDIVKKLFAENPNLKEEDAVNKLKEIKDPKTRRPMWKAITIRNRVNAHVRSNGKVKDAPITASNESPVETKGSGSDIKINGKNDSTHESKEIKKQNDPFEIESIEKVEKSIDKMEDINTIDAEQFKKEIINDISIIIRERVSDEIKSFKKEIVSIVGDLKTSMIGTITDIKREMKTIQTNGIGTYEPVVEYDEIKLKKSTINSMKEIIEERDIKEESDLINTLIDNEKEYTSVPNSYNNLVELAKGAKNGFLLRLFYNKGELSYKEIRIGRFGINLKSFIAVLTMGIAIGVIIVLVVEGLTTVAVPPQI